jgi:hypothetical protein
MNPDVKKKKDEALAVFRRSMSTHVGDKPDPEAVKAAVKAALETHPLAAKPVDVKMSADGQSLDVQLEIPVNTVEMTFEVGPGVEERLEEIIDGD